VALFAPFRGVRYNPDAVKLDDVVSPPYDIIDDDELEAIEARSPYNAARVDRLRDDSGADRYQAAARRFDEWLAAGVLATDPSPALYYYRMGYRDADGDVRQTAGLIGALELCRPGEGDVLPHERTMSKPKDDRLALMRACRANLSPVWGLSLARGLSGLCEPAGPPIARCTDSEGVHHRLWRIDEPARIEGLCRAVGSAPVVIADGHHRYETALAYRDERRQAAGGAGGDYDLIMAYVVELVDDQLAVGPIHRMIVGLPDGFDLLGALSAEFRVEPVPAGSGVAISDGVGGAITARMDEAGALGLITPAGAWLLRPRHPGDRPGPEQVDSRQAEAVLAGLPGHSLEYHHDPLHVASLVASGSVQAGLLLRSPTVSQIETVARAGERMPEKTSFFRPKPRTGLVFRRFED